MNDFDWHEAIAMPCEMSYACPVRAFPSIVEQHRHNRRNALLKGFWLGDFSEIQDNAWKKPARLRRIFSKLVDRLEPKDVLYVTHPRVIINAPKDIRQFESIDFTIQFCWCQCSITRGEPSDPLKAWLDGLAGKNRNFPSVKPVPFAAVKTAKGLKWDAELRNAMHQVVTLRDQQKMSFRKIAELKLHPKITTIKTVKSAYLHEKAYRILNVRFPQEFDKRLMPDEDTLIKANTPTKPAILTTKAIYHLNLLAPIT